MSHWMSDTYAITFIYKGIDRERMALVGFFLLVSAESCERKRERGFSLVLHLLEP